MDTREVADRLNELAEEREAQAEAEREARARERLEGQQRERFRQRAALLIAGLAMLLAVTSVGGGNAMEEIISKNIEASDTWNFFQAKNIRQTDYRIGADTLQTLLGAGLIPEATRPEVETRIRDYRATVERYETEPEEGKRDLFAKARKLEAARDHARAQDANFDLAEAFFQIAIVLGSVAILATSRPILYLTVAFGVVATFFMVNGFLVFVPLPWA